MNFQQLRSVREAVRRGFNLTEVAVVLHTSQPGISRQIRELEDELGVEIFVRAGKRLTGLTPAGERVLPWVERLLLETTPRRGARSRTVPRPSTRSTCRCTPTASAGAASRSPSSPSRGRPGGVGSASRWW